MGLSEADREALRAYWLGEPLEGELAQLLGGGRAEGEEEARRRAEALEFLAEMPRRVRSQTDRLTMQYGPLAVAGLVKLLGSDKEETVRRAADSLLKRFDKAAVTEMAEAEAAAGRVEDAAELLTDEQAATVLGVLADAGVVERLAGTGGGVAVAPGVARVDDAGEAGDEVEDD